MNKKVIILGVTFIICVLVVYLGVRHISKHAPPKYVPPEKKIVSTQHSEKRAKKAVITKRVYEAPVEEVYDSADNIISFYKEAAINNDGKRTWQIIHRIIGRCKEDAFFCSDVVSAMQEMLFNGQNLELRQYAALLLSQIGNQQAASLLIDAAMADPGNIGGYLAEMRNEEAVPMLVFELKNGPSSVSKYLTMAFANIGSEDAVSALIDFLNETDDPITKGQAETALRQVKNEEAIPVFKKLLTENGPNSYKRIGIDALTYMGNGKATAALVDTIKEVRDDNLKSDICASLSRIHRPDGVRIIERLALKERDPYIRRWGVVALGEHPKMLPVLEQIAKNDRSEQVRKVALKQIRRLTARREK